jgi:predicted PurR-regulated permease PerM
MNEYARFPRSTVWVLTLSAIVIILAAVQAAEPIVTPFLISLFIAAISAPGMLWLTRHGIPQAVALVIMMVIIIGLATLLSGLVGSSLDGFSKNLPQYQTRLQDIAAQILGWLAAYGLEVDMDKARSMLDLSAAMGFVGSAFNRLLGTLANAFLIFLTVAFILMELPSFGDKIQSISNDPARSLANFGRFSNTLNRYLVIKSAMSLATGATVALALYIFGVDYPLLWGIVAFLLNFVPNIGSVIAAIPAVLMALVQYGFVSAGWVALVYIVVNSVFGNLIEPKLMGRSLGLSTLVVFISLVFWGWLLGPVGMFLSVPLTMTLKIAFESSDETRWLAVLLGAEHDLTDSSVARPLPELPAVDVGDTRSGTSPKIDA